VQELATKHHRRDEMQIEANGRNKEGNSFHMAYGMSK